jgi:hypothetical protein
MSPFLLWEVVTNEEPLPVKPGSEAKISGCSAGIDE